MANQNADSEYNVLLYAIKDVYYKLKGTENRTVVFFFSQVSLTSPIEVCESSENELVYLDQTNRRAPIKSHLL